MSLKRYRSWFLGLALLSLLSTGRVSAISPYAVLVYGDQLKEPVVIYGNVQNITPLGMLWWRAGRFDGTHTLKGDPVQATLTGRGYLKLAIFWGVYAEDQLKPENASQHGRLYLPTASAPATVAVTVPNMQPKPAPIPKDLDEFAGAWTLQPGDIVIAKAWGIPGL